MESRIETTLLTEEPPVSFDFLEELVEQRVGPGILLLSPALKLMHMNRRAWALCMKNTQGGNRKGATSGRPPAGHQICAPGIAARRARIPAHDRGTGHVNAPVCDPKTPLA